MLQEKDKDFYNKARFGYTMQGDYLFIKKGNQVEFMKIFNNPNYDKEVAKQLNLKLNDDCELMRILDTEKPNLIQLVFVQGKKENT